MKEIVPSERIAAARESLAKLLDLSGPRGNEVQVRNAVLLLSSVVDELATAYGNEIRFNTLTETATDGIISINDQSTICYVNPAAGQMFGYDLSEMLGKNLTDLMPERFRQIHLASVSKYVSTGTKHIRWRAVELIGLHKSGREFPIEISFGEDVRNDGHFFTGIVRDITERKRSEEALRTARKQSEEQQLRHARLIALRADVQAAFFGGAESPLQTMLQRSAEAMVRHLDAAFARLWTLNELENALELRASAGQYTHLDGGHARVPVGQLKIGLIAQERKPRLTNDVLHDDRISDPDWARREGMVAFAGYPLLAEGRLVGVLAMFAREALGPETLEVLASVADTIAQGIVLKLAEEKLRESEHNLRLFMDTIPQMLWSATPDGEIDYWNQRFVDYTGLSADELRGAGWLEAVHPDDRDTMVEEWRTAVSEGLPYQFEFRSRRATDGMYRSCVSSALPLRGQTGRVLKWYGSIVDLHDWKQAQEALRSRDAELAHTTRVMAMGEITSSIAHEINQPLGAIVNYGNACLRLIKSGSGDLADIASALSEIVNDANRASGIIARIRALSKKAPLEMEALQVKDLVTDILLLVRHELTGHRIELETVLPEDLCPVLGDRVQLQQVLLNLVINSIEAMNEVPEDRRQLFIEAQPYVSEDRPFVLVTVADSGRGLKAEDLPKLFESFYTTKPEGMGMGLAISRSIVEGHGGRLWATPNPNLGATFQFTVPVST